MILFLSFHCAERSGGAAQPACRSPSECFHADDALGWTYQFWQAQRKKEVNDSGKKIGADELSPVTQLFTEDYMVEFLLHNTIGAWWAGKLGPIQADTEEEARIAPGRMPRGCAGNRVELSALCAG